MKYALIFSSFVFIYFGFNNLESKNIGQETGYKIPRFVSLKSNEVNLRIGSSINYPIILKYTSKNIPLEVIDEYGSWRKITDIKNNIGWIHKSLLKGDRFAIINPLISQTSMIFYKPNGMQIGTIGKNNIVKIKKCTIDWCKIEHSKFKAWILKKNLWGIYDYELINIPFYQPLVDLIWRIEIIFLSKLHET